MFHFTIRDVLWLTVVVAVAMGWWFDRGGLFAKAAAAERKAAGYQEAFGDLLDVEYARMHGLPLPAWYDRAKSD